MPLRAGISPSTVIPEPPADADEYLRRLAAVLRVELDEVRYYLDQLLRVPNPVKITAYRLNNETALQIEQLSVGAVAGAHINLNDKAGAPPSPVTGDIWRSGDGLFWRQSTGTVDLTSTGPGGVGDSVLANAVAAVDADFNDSTPGPPTGDDLNVKWQISGSDPSSISAYVDASALSPKIDHEVLQNPTVDTHTQYLLADGTRSLTGDMLVTSTNKITFNDASQYIHGNSTTEMSLAAPAAINVSTAILKCTDIVGALRYDIGGSTTSAPSAGHLYRIFVDTADGILKANDSSILTKFLEQLSTDTPSFLSLTDDATDQTLTGDLGRLIIRTGDSPDKVVIGDPTVLTTTPAVSTLGLLSLASTVANPSASTIGLMVNQRITGTPTSGTQTFQGFNVFPIYEGTTSQTGEFALIAGRYWPRFRGSTATITHATGVSAKVASIGGSAGTITNAYCFKAEDIQVQASQTIVNAYGFYSQTHIENSTGAFTNCYGAYLEDQAAGSGINRSLHCVGEAFFGATVITNEGRRVNTTRITGNTTLDTTRHNVFADTDGGAITVTLPAGVAGTAYRIINSGSASNNLTITPDGSELLLGANSNFTLLDGDVLAIVYEATEGWW